ncbi:hypothetical protein [Actinoplanes sp. OR16]|uniref:hypothetical protein n=1 Tax=Actinoplanes sp. OR16 TaxID=946334 RepID=UPI000FDB02EE|nr:hypothetical protein [Actinoplanes sp. OR16]
MKPAARFAAVAALLFVTAAGLASLLFVPVRGSIEKGFEPGEPVVLPLKPEATMVWATTRTAVWCDYPDQDGGFSQVSMRDQDLWIERKRTTWYGVLTLQSWPAGDRTVTCDGGIELAIGRPPLVHDARTEALVILGSFFAAAAGLGLAAAALARRRTTQRAM